MSPYNKIYNRLMMQNIFVIIVVNVVLFRIATKNEIKDRSKKEDN